MRTFKGFNTQKVSIRAVVFAALMIFAGGAGISALVSTSTTAAEALGVRFGTSGDQTRIVVDLEGKVAPRISETSHNGDRRLTMVMPGINMPGFKTGQGKGVVNSWEGETVAKGTKFEFDLAGDVSISRKFLLKPGAGINHYRYIIDLAPQKQKSSSAAIQLARQVFGLDNWGKRVVVIDAGHGGKDPGAHKENTSEKDVNLTAARMLKQKLEKTGRYEVVMTRDRDVFIPLKERVRKARAADADLFISLHADSGPAAAKGASVYTLSEKASSRVANSIVNGNNWIVTGSELGRKSTDVKRILVDLTQRETRNQSARFAQKLTRNLKPVTPLLRNTHRNAGFVVLLAPDVPAVLLEMGFLSNAQDRKRLNNKNHQNKLMQSVADSIDEYFASQTARIASLR